MKKKLFGLTLAVVFALGLNVAIFGAGNGSDPPWVHNIPICLDCCDLNCPE